MTPNTPSLQVPVGSISSGSGQVPQGSETLSSQSQLCLRIFLILIGLLTAITIVHTVLVFRGGAGLTDESGVLTGMAMDAHHGVFYRPLFSSLGYGGTRYGPLHIALHAALMNFLSPIVSGHVIAITAAAGVLITQFLILRQLGVARSMAATASLLLLATASAQYAIATIRVDMLATLCSMCGIYLVLRSSQTQQDRPIALSLATVVFALAGLTKFTTIFGVVASFLFLITQRRWKSAIFVPVATLALFLTGVASFNFASHGQLLINWRACANGGRSPLGITGWLDVVKQAWITGDHGGLLASLCAAVMWGLAPRQMKFSLLGWLFLCTVPLTLLMFFSPGIAMNHLLDADITACLFLALLTTIPNRRTLAMVTMILITCVGLVECGRGGWIRKSLYHRLDFYRSAMAKAGYKRGTIFSDNSLVPVAAGQSPFLLDDFNMQAMRNSYPQAEADLYHRVATKYFPVIVLRADPEMHERRWTLGAGFKDLLIANYELVDKTTGWDRLWVYRPRKTP